LRLNLLPLENPFVLGEEIFVHRKVPSSDVACDIEWLVVIKDIRCDLRFRGVDAGPVEVHTMVRDETLLAVESDQALPHNEPVTVFFLLGHHGKRPFVAEFNKLTARTV